MGDKEPWSPKGKGAPLSEAGGRWGAWLAEAAGRQPSGQEREAAGKSKEEKTASERRKPGQPRRLYLVDWGTAPAASVASREGGRSCHQSLFPCGFWTGGRNQEASLEVAGDTCQ